MDFDELLRQVEHNYEEDKIKALVKLAKAVERASWFEHVSGGFVVSEKDGNRIIQAAKAIREES